MSHFAVLVITKTPYELETALQPFHEYECTGTKDQYVVWVDETDEMTAEYNNPKSTVPCIFQNGKMICRRWDADKHKIEMAGDLPVNGELRDVPMKEVFTSVADMAVNYHGYDGEENIKPDGRIGRLTNPNAKWDWWVIGGRWSNFLHLKAGGKTDQALKIDIDFDTPKKQARARAEKEYDKAQKVLDGQTFMNWQEVRAKFSEDIDKARDFYHGQKAVQDLRTAFESPWIEYEEFLKDREQYLHDTELDSISTYAVLKDGKWLSNGTMGWFGMSLGEDENWKKDFGTILDSIDDDEVLTIVDCHI